MTTEQAKQIRDLVDRGGWAAVRVHPVLGPIWAKAVAEQRKFEAAL
jgi:hypothetical protein